MLNGCNLKTDCSKNRAKPFLTKQSVVKYNNGSYRHIIMINGCSTDFRGYIKLAIQDYIKTTDKLPISEVLFLKYKKGGYKEIISRDISKELYINSLFLLYLDTKHQNKNVNIIDIGTFVDGKPLNIFGP